MVWSELSGADSLVWPRLDPILSPNRMKFVLKVL